MKRLGIVLCVAMLAWPAHANTADAEPEVSVSLEATPRKVRVGDTFSLEVRASVKGGGLESVRLEDLRKYPELEVVSHQTSRPTQISFGFGSGMQVESSVSHLYAMRPLAPGTYTFSPAVATIDGKDYESQGLTIEVVGAAVDFGDPRGEPPDDDELTGARYDPDSFVRTVVEPTTAFLGQQVDVSVYLYARVGVVTRTVSPTKLSMDGFWVYDEQVQNLQSDVVTVNGTRFQRFLLQRSAAFPQRTGTLTVGAPKVTFDGGGRSIFDPARRIERSGVAVEVEVEPLPPPGPSDAYVGNIELTASIDRPEVDTGDAVTLRIQSAGAGNTQDLRIELPTIPGVRALQPAIQDQRRFSGDTMGGVRTWEWILIADQPGKHVVPPISIPYFDPKIKKYGTATTNLVAFKAEGSAAPKPTLPSSPSVAPPRPDETQFGPIRVYSALSRGSAPLRKRAWFPWLLAFPPFAFLLLTVAVGFSRRRGRDRSSAEAVQRERLAAAKKALRDQDPRGFYDAVVDTLIHAVETRTNDPVRGLPNTDLRSRLAEAGFDEDLIGRVINELDGADFARFAASGVDGQEMSRCLERVETILERIRRLGGRAS
ncbi:MAG: BatD family protein [Myxococcota bacterium]